MLHIPSLRLSKAVIVQLLSIVVWSCLPAELHSQDVATEKSIEISAHFEPFNPSGALVICGGGSLPDEARKLFVRASGGAKAKIVIVPTASSYADKKKDEYWIKDWRPFKLDSITSLAYPKPKRG